MATRVLAEPTIACADWCVGDCDGGTACLSESYERTVRCTGAGTTADDRGMQRYKEARLYLTREVGWNTAGLPKDEVCTVHIATDLEGWLGTGDDIGLTVEEAQSLAALLLDCAARASVDRAQLLAAGHSVVGSVA